MDPAATLDLLRRSRLLDPLRVGALATGFGRWGPTIAAGVMAGAIRTPFGVALIGGTERLSWRQLDRRTTRLARGLLDAGARRGGRAAVLCRNHAGFVVALAGVAKAGLTPVLLNTGSSAAQLDEIIDREEVDLVIADSDRLDDLRSTSFAGPLVDAGRLDGVAPAGRSRIEPLLPSTAVPVLMTSGTTGVPKGARRTVRSGSPSVGLGMLEVVPFRGDDVFVIPAPLFHAWGFGNLMIAMVLGARVVVVDRPSPAAIVDAVVAHRATVLVAVPVMLQRILAEPDLDLEPLQQLRVTASSGSALAGALATEWMDRAGDNLYNLYGSTEVGSATIATPVDLRHAPGTAGRAIPGCEIRILDDAGHPVAAGEPGRIFVAGGGAIDGYSGGGSKEVIDGAMSTGDTGVLRDGLLFISGRSDDMIVSGGENVFPRVVEDVVLGCEGVADAAVVGVPDAEFGQRLRAHVQVEADASVTAEAIEAAVRVELGRHYVPRDVVFVDEIPRNATGKLLRRGLS